LLLFRADVHKSMRKISAFLQADGRFVFPASTPCDDGEGVWVHGSRLNVENLEP
jgi:hypothetical protein